MQNLRSTECARGSENAALDRRTLRLRIARTENLLVHHIALNALYREAAEPHPSMPSLAAAISREPSLVAKILKVANSPVYGGVSVGTITKAIGMIGVDHVRTLILEFIGTQSNIDSPRLAAFDRRAHWEHSLGTAVAARVIMKKSTPMRAEEAYAAGLLRNLGVLVLDRFFAVQLVQAIDYANHAHTPLEMAERDIIGFDHYEAAAITAEEWRFPEPLRAAIGTPGEDQLDNGDHLKAAVFAAEALARETGFLGCTVHLDFDESRRRYDAARLTDPEVAEIRQIVVHEVLKAQQAYGIA